MTEPALLRTRLRDAAEAFLALRPAVLAGAPWPLAADFGHSSEARWGPPEVLAHVAEMLPYWLGEVERIVAAAPDPVPFGRVATDAVRLAILGCDRTLPLRELVEHTAQLRELLGVPLQSLTAEATRAARGRARTVRSRWVGGSACSVCVRSAV